MSGICVSISAEDVDALVQMVVERLESALALRDASDQRWPAFMSVETAASYLDVSVERVRKLKERYEIPFVQEAPGHRVVFARADLDAWMTTMRCWRGSKGGA